MAEEIKEMVDNNQQIQSEEKSVINPLNPEIMENKNNSGINLERNNTIVNDLNNNDMKSTPLASTDNNNALKDMIQNNNLPTKISTLYQILQDAKTKLVQCNGKREQNARKRVRKAQNDLKEALQQTLLPTPIEEWRYNKGKDGNSSIEIITKMVMIAAVPSLVSLAVKDRLAMDIVDDELFEKNTEKHLTAAGMFFDENITLTTLNGVSIEQKQPDLYVMVGSPKEQRTIQAIYNWNIEALIEDKPLTPITNIKFKEFNSIQECAKYISTNTLLDRGLKGKEKLGLAALATEDEFMKKICEVCEKEKMPMSTAIKYYASGKTLTNSQINKAARGTLPEEFKYDLSNGEEIIEVLHSLNFGKEIKKRYIIDAFTSFSKLPDEEGNPFGIDRALKALQAFTSNDVVCIQETKEDKINLITSRLTSKLKDLQSID